MQNINVVLDQQNHHLGSIYCVDWSKTENIIATGSNDRLIKLLICPNLDQPNHSQVYQMELQGHSAIVRTVCFNPRDDLVLLSGGQSDHAVKVWNCETGQNVANLTGHTGDIHCIKMAADGSFAVSVSTDGKILLFDVRAQKAVGSLDATGFSEMHDVALSNLQQSSIGATTNMQSINSGGDTSANQDSLNGFAAVGHNDGSVSIWNLQMRQCFAHHKLHS